MCFNNLALKNYNLIFVYVFSQILATCRVIFLAGCHADLWESKNCLSADCNKMYFVLVTKLWSFILVTKIRLIYYVRLIDNFLSFLVVTSGVFIPFFYSFYMTVKMLNKIIWTIKSIYHNYNLDAVFLGLRGLLCSGKNYHKFYGGVIL